MIVSVCTGIQSEFVKWLNSIHLSIKFSSESSMSHVNFLDTTVYRTSEHKLVIKTYVKSTDMNIYLHFSSHHPRHLKTNLPYGQFLRIKRNSMDEEQFRKKNNYLAQQFAHRGS